MFSPSNRSIPSSRQFSRRSRLVVAIACIVPLLGIVGANGPGEADTATKRIIGATAFMKEVSTGLTFAARVDTGAETCSLHVEKIEIKNESPKPTKNRGKAIRFLVKNEQGKSDWIETTIADVVLVKSSAQPSGELERRYKVRLSLRCEGYRKEVLVTLTDRTDMDYPLLIGRNYLRGEFLVDVDKDNPE
jgi:hypothetical protein